MRRKFSGESEGNAFHMKKIKSQSRQNSANLQKRLSSYLTAAGAVGAAGLAFAPGTQAAIIYTDIPDVTVKASLSSPYVNHLDFYDLNLDGDGVVDFQVINQWDFDNPTLPFSWIYPNIVANKVMNKPFPGTIYNYAIKLAPGASVGSGGPFIPNGYSGKAYGDFAYSLDGGTTVYGDWAGQGDGFVGLQFDISGQAHFGWVRVSVSNYDDGFAVTIKDYAYNSVADEPIVIPEPSSLALMALGAIGIVAHRRRVSKTA
jgi:hypothetical protein